MPISARGSSLADAVCAAGAPRRQRGFTLIELMLVVAIIAIATGVASLALRDPTAAKLEQEAVRLAALLESARAEARSSGVPARWEPLEKQADGSDFRFVGLSAKDPLPTRFLETGTAAQVTILTGTSGDGSDLDYERLASTPGTLVVFMGLRRLEHIADGLILHGRRVDEPAAVVSKQSLPDQRVVVGTLATIAGLAADLPSPSLVIVGDVASLAWQVRAAAALAA